MKENVGGALIFVIVWYFGILFSQTVVLVKNNVLSALTAGVLFEVAIFAMQELSATE